MYVGNQRTSWGNIIINPKPITKENFSKYGDVITTKDIKPLEINDGTQKDLMELLI